MTEEGKQGQDKERDGGLEIGIEIVFIENIQVDKILL